MLEAILQKTFWNNPIKEYLIALGIFLGIFLAFRLFNYAIINRLEKLAKKSKTTWDDLIIDFLKGIGWFFYLVISLYIAIQYLQLPTIINKIFYYVTIVLAGFYIAKGISKSIEHFIEIQTKKRGEKKEVGNTSMMKVFGLLAKIIIWTIALLMILSNFGIEITPLIASLGIGGIAIALALQAVLGDLFGAFVIYFDKPFKEGDFIIIGSDMGVVKHIGIKSTRIETLQGQELVVSNKELTSTRINNYKRMQKRRIQFSFGVEYDTGSKKLNKIKKIVDEIFKKVKNADLDRVHFKEFGDFSLNYEVVYYVNTADYNKYMDTQEEINLKLYKEFEKEGINFAFPTQTIFLNK
jgi:small-conductance mechanosensitive channel